MKKLSKIFLCIALVFCTTFGLTACSVGEVEENTRKAVETTTSIIPVEYSKETAEGVFNAALYKMYATEKVDVKLNTIEMDGVNYIEEVMNQRFLIKDGKRYICYLAEDYSNASFATLVIGLYGEDNKKYFIDGETKKYAEVPVFNGDEDPLDPDVIIAKDAAEDLAEMLEALDVVSSLSILSDYIVSGRYFDGATYINVDDGMGNKIEIKIVNGEFVSMNQIVYEDYILTATYTFTYGDDVDVSMIPTTLDGLTETTLGLMLGTTPVTPES